MSETIDREFVAGVARLAAGALGRLIEPPRVASMNPLTPSQSTGIIAVLGMVYESATVGDRLEVPPSVVLTARYNTHLERDVPKLAAALREWADDLFAEAVGDCLRHATT